MGTAAASDWVASKVRQPAMFKVDNQNWATITNGIKIPNRSWIHTGKSGRVMLRRGSESIQFKPKTMAAIAKRNRSGLKTAVVQQFGELLLDVETRKQKHLEVETPFLAAVVKGMTFTVKVNSKSTKLAVQKDVFEVTDERRGLQTEVGTGQSVRVLGNAQGNQIVLGPGPKVKVARVKKTAHKIQPTSGAGGKPAVIVERKASSLGASGQADLDGESDTSS